MKDTNKFDGRKDSHKKYDTKRNQTEERREYQREYQRKYAQQRNRLAVPPKTITWEELQELRHIDMVDSYKECVKQGLALTKNARVEKIALSLLAIRACVIKHGQDQKKKPNQKTVTAFANEINVNHKTLLDWVVVVSRTYLHLPQTEQLTYNMNVAKIALDDVGRQQTSEQVIDNYKYILNDSAARMAYRFRRYLSSAEQALIHPGVLTKLSKKEREFCRKRAARILDILK